jgi:predicted DNA-binding transcriptional regulator AlpA
MPSVEALAPVRPTIEPRITGTVDTLTVDNAGAAKLLGISESHLYALKRTGRLGPAPIRLGRCCRFLVSELRAWCEAGCPSRSRWQAMRGK